MTLRKDYSGSKFGHLTLMHFVSPGGKGVGAKWGAQCDCGERCIVVARYVIAGRIKTCGNCQLKRDLVARAATRKEKGPERCYKLLAHQALRRGIPWTLTPEQCTELTRKNCLLCGDSPAHKLRGIKYYYNYLDRIDHALPFTLENTIPACLDCIRIRGKATLEDFLDKVTKLHNSLSAISG